MTPPAQGAQSLLTLEARNHDTGQILSRDSVKFVPFSSIVVVIGGTSQGLSDPPGPSAGIYRMATDLYAKDAYDVHEFSLVDGAVASGNDQTPGSGPAFNEIANAIKYRGVTHISILGYSHGGGATYLLAKHLTEASDGIATGKFAIDFTAYVDAIEYPDSAFEGPERRLPPSTRFHTNLYQTKNWIFPIGASVTGSNDDQNVNLLACGTKLEHQTIDDSPQVVAWVEMRVEQQVPP